MAMFFKTDSSFSGEENFLGCEKLCYDEGLRVCAKSSYSSHLGFLRNRKRSKHLGICKMKVTRNNKGMAIEARDYKLVYESTAPMYIDLEFNNGIGSKLFVPSGCDRDEMIDEIIRLEAPVIEEKDDCAVISFTGETTPYTV